MLLKDSVMQLCTGMLQSINIQDMLLLFLFGAAIAMLGMAFQAFMRPGQIFNWYAIWLINCIDKATKKTKKKVLKKSCYGGSGWETIDVEANIFYKVIAFLSKPLGLCPYCNTTWIAIIFFIIYFEISFNIFLLIGIVWFFVKLIIMLNSKEE